jgi:hypothetical protein
MAAALTIPMNGVKDLAHRSQFNGFVTKHEGLYIKGKDTKSYQHQFQPGFFVIYYQPPIKVR